MNNIKIGDKYYIEGVEVTKEMYLNLVCEGYADIFKRICEVVGRGN